MMQLTMARLWSFVVLLCCHCTSTTNANKFANLQTFGIQPNDNTPHTIIQNTKLFSELLQSDAAASSSFSLRISVEQNQTFYFHHGVQADGIKNMVFRIDGKIQFVRDKHEKWNKDTNGENGKRPVACLYLTNVTNVTFTSSSDRYNYNKQQQQQQQFQLEEKVDPAQQRGIIHGGGQDWWGIPGLGYLRMQEHRPMLLHIAAGKNILLENLIFLDSPFWTLWLVGVDGVIIRRASIIATRTPRNGHDLVDLTAFNTDGIDIAGHNVHVHDVDIWNQDDCIAVKDNLGDGNVGADGVSSNMLFERIHASGLGLVIGSIGSDSTVRNITFRNSFLYSTFKGIYMKFRTPKNNNMSSGGVIEDIRYDNITMESPKQWAIWIGPAQQLRTIGGTCDLSWPINPFFTQCETPASSKFRNIVLQNINIHNPDMSPGVILGSKMNPIDGIVFDNVVVTQSSAPVLLPEQRFDFFPGLKIGHPAVKDIYIQRGYRILVSGGFIVVTIACSLIWRCVYRKKQLEQKHHHELLSQDEEEETNTDEASGNSGSTLSQLDMSADEGGIDDASEDYIFPIHRNTRQSICCIGTCLIPIISLVYFIIWAVITSKEIDDTTNYFVCDGVRNGIATGNTWPIPQCFLDDTS